MITGDNPIIFRAVKMLIFIQTAKKGLASEKQAVVFNSWLPVVMHLGGFRGYTTIWQSGCIKILKNRGCLDCTLYMLKNAVDIKINPEKLLSFCVQMSLVGTQTQNAGTLAVQTDGWKSNDVLLKQQLRNAAKTRTLEMFAKPRFKPDFSGLKSRVSHVCWLGYCCVF